MPLRAHIPELAAPMREHRATVEHIVHAQIAARGGLRADT
jgi:hypothetical protein